MIATTCGRPGDDMYVHVQIGYSWWKASTHPSSNINLTTWEGSRIELHHVQGKQADE